MSDPRKTGTGRPPGPRLLEVGGEQDDSEWLDREHQARVSRVADCDTADDRRTAAEVELGRLTEEEQELYAERNALGSYEHIDAITKSRWLPYQPALQKGARTLWFFDALLWTALCASIIWQLVRSYNA